MREMDKPLVIAFIVLFVPLLAVGYFTGIFFAKDNVINYTEGVNLTSISEWVADSDRTPEDFNALLDELSNAIK